MGNIISNTSDLSDGNSGGNSAGNLGIAGTVLNEDGTKNAFVQNLTDILLELNLFNTGNYKVVAGKNDGPRSEFDYSKNAYTLNPVLAEGAKSADTNNGNGRPIRNNKLIDLFGIPYVTTETPLPASGGDNDSSSSIPLPAYQPRSYVVDNQFYNIKRAVCNLTTKIPVSMVGVDLPGDDPDMKNYIDVFTGDNARYLRNILNDQKNKTYNLPSGADLSGSTAISDMVNNCLTWGTIESENTIPVIPDLTATSPLILNDYSNKTNTTTSIPTKPHNIYDRELTEECVNLLDSMIINSYTTPNIENYSKWKPSDITNLSSIKSGASSLIHDYSSNNIAIIPNNGNTTLNPTNIPNGFNHTTTNIFGMGSFSTSATSGTLAQADMNQTCQNFEQDLCKWYYYYDLQDGITANKDSVINNQNASNFANNIQYLLSHIPDCRCQSYLETGSSRNYDNYYWDHKCFALRNYGQSTDDNNTTYPDSQFAAGQKSQPMKIYNVKKDDKNYIAYRRQMDPIGVQRPGTTDKLWGFISNSNRTRPVTNSTIICNMDITNNISNTQGNVVVGNIEMSCGEKVECEGDWVNNNNCNAQCNSDGTPGAGTFTETYTITKPAKYGGKECDSKDGDLREKPCYSNPCPPGAVNCIGVWENTDGAQCSAECPQTNGTISKTWKTTTPASDGGAACPSISTINAPCTIPCVSSSSSIDPIFTSVNLIDPSNITPTYSIPLEENTPILEPFTNISANLSVNSAIVSSFTSNYDFLLFLTSDPTNIVKCQYSGSSCSSDIEGSCSPYIIIIPFIYGPSTLVQRYNLGIKNKPNNNTNVITPIIYNIPLSVKQYSMTISNISVSIISSNPYVVFTINPGTFDNIIGLSIRIVLTPKNGSSPEVSKNYTDLFSTLRNNNNVIMIGGDNSIIEPIEYNYKIMINENVVNSIPVTYTDGYQMNYDQIFPTNKQESIDLSSIVSQFNSTLLQYINYNNNNNITNILANDTLLIGSTILFSWIFTSIDPSLINVCVYYDTDTTYIPSSISSPTSVLLKISDLGELNPITNNYSYSINFICPFITSQSIIFYAVASGSDPFNNVYSSSIKVNLPDILSIPTIQNWQIITNNTNSDMINVPAESLTPILKPNETIPTIDNYFSAGYAGRYSYIIYNPIDILWYGSNAEPEPLSTPITNLSYTMFKNPYNQDVEPVITITSITSSGTTKYTPDIITSIILEIGAELTLNYQIINITSDTNFQLILANRVIKSFVLNKDSPTSGSITFTVFGDISIVSPKLYLTSYEIWNSTPILLVLNNSGAIRETISKTSDIPASTGIYTNIQNPAINITAQDNDKAISTLNISYNVMPENQYFTELSSFGKPLSINNMLLTFGTMNFLLPFLYIIHNSGAEGFTSNNYEPFTNTRQLYLESKKSKKNKTIIQKTHINSNLVESFSESFSGSLPNTLTIDTITLDFSSSTLDTLNNIQLMFSGYTSVSIQNMILIFGDLSLNNKKFSILINSNSQIITTFSILNITFIGSLSSNIFLTNPIPGLEKVYYSANKLINNRYALIVPLIYSNGMYSLPQSYQSRLKNIEKLTESSIPEPDPIKAPVPPTQAPVSGGFLSGISTGTGIGIMFIIIIGLVILGIIGYLTYITLYPPKK
jgi:hypothetical protein